MDRLKEKGKNSGLSKSLLTKSNSLCLKLELSDKSD